MKTLFSVCLLSALCSLTLSYETIYYDQLIDHYSQIQFGGQTFKQRVLVDDTYFNYKKCQNHQGQNCAVLFYSGNEGAITGFYDNSGFIMELAEQNKALVVFAEHRFYGESLPFGHRESFKWPNLGVLTVDQAVADYARFLVDFKANYSIPNATVISFGGSYGGMLTAYLRFKFPNVVKGALAASAPVHLADSTDRRAMFWSSVTQDYSNVGKDVSKKVKQGFTDLDNLAALGHSGYKEISHAFNLCQLIMNNDDYKQLLYAVRNAFTVMTMFDYPEPSNFMSPLPAWPVNASSALIRDASSPIEALVAVTKMVYNDTENPSYCFNTYEMYIACSDPTGCGLGNDAKAWDFQVCYELNLAFGSDGVNDMFPYLPWTDAMRDNYCHKKYPHMSSRHDWMATNYWGSNVWSATNIIWSNGRLDPWYRGGIKKSSNPTQPVVIIDDGAHHVDLRASKPTDTPSITTARVEESYLVKKMLQKHYD